MSQPIAGTVVEAYLRKRGITALHGTGSLRFHPRCYYRPDAACADRDLAGDDRRRHRSRRHDHRRASHLARPIGAGQGADRHADDARWAISSGNAVRFGVARDVMAAGEGIETMLSLRCVMPTMPMVAALSAAHLAAILFPATLRRLYIARDDDPAGRRRDGEPDRPGERGRDRGDRPVATTGRLQRGSPHARHRRATGSAAGADRPARTSLASWNWRHEAGTGDERPRRRRSSCRIRSWCFLSLSERTAPTAF